VRIRKCVESLQEGGLNLDVRTLTHDLKELLRSEFKNALHGGIKSLDCENLP